MNDDATARRRQLGRALRQARKQARAGKGLTQDAVARQLGCGQAKINKIERTLVSISLPELNRLIEIYQIPDEKAADLRRLAELDQREGPGRRHDPSMSAYKDLSDLEPEASEITCWHGERIPGPLQSESYMLAQHGITRDGDVLELLSMRRARAQIFSQADPPRYRVILSESSLHRMPGGRSPELVVNQVAHLKDLVEQYDHLELQILTFAAKIRFVETDFQILRFNNSDLDDFAYIEHSGGSNLFKQPDKLSKFQDHWELLSNAALNSEDTIGFLAELAKKDEL